MNDLRNSITVLSGRLQPLRRRLAAGEVTTARIDLDLATMQAAVNCLVAAVDRLDAELDEPPAS